jgi:hypothetical protein
VHSLFPFYSGVVLYFAIILKTLLGKELFLLASFVGPCSFLLFLTLWHLDADFAILGRMWPVNVGLGFGLGRSYGDCDRQFNPNSVPGWRLSKPSSRHRVAEEREMG